MRRKRTLVLMRGLPGSGKSTLAKSIALDHLRYGGSSVVICSTDDYHFIDDRYVFQPHMLGTYHRQNQLRVKYHMYIGIELIIVDNTNVQRKDMKPYLDYAEELVYKVEEVLLGEDELFPNLKNACPYKFADYIHLCAERNTHGVTKDAIENMARKFQL